MRRFKFSNGTGFTLIELIGVMAIIGILSAVVLPPLISKIEDANTTKEDANLEEIGRALVAGIKASGKIPNPNLTPYNTGTGGGWGDIAKLQTTLTDDSAGPGTLHYVFPREDQTIQEASARRVYVDDGLMGYLVSQTGSATGLFETPATGWPETTAGGVVFPNQAMNMYIVSSSKKGLELYCMENQPGTGMNPSPQPGPGYGAGLIADLQNWVKTAEPTSSADAGSFMVPSSIARWGTASGSQYRRGEFLHVKVVDLRPLFCRVELIEYPLPQNAATTTTTGSGYTASTAYNGTSSSGFVFEFTTPAGATTYPAAGGTAGTYKSGRGMIKRTGLTVNDSGNIPSPGGGPSAGFSASITSTAPYPPWWVISPYTLAADSQQMPIASNTQAFYVLKGTSLSLYAAGLARPTSSILTVQINADCSFEYFNGSWSRVD